MFFKKMGVILDHSQLCELNKEAQHNADRKNTNWNDEYMHLFITLSLYFFCILYFILVSLPMYVLN